jgi:PAS domain S-box-containing protein
MPATPDSPGIREIQNETDTLAVAGNGPALRDYLVPVGMAVFVTIFLWVISLFNFALYHTTIEFTTIAISVAIFLLVWKSRKIIDNHYLLFIGFTFIFIAILDFLHTLVYQGVGIFPDGGGVLSTRFWIAARYMQAITLLAAPLFIRRNLRLDLVAFIYLVADILVVSSILIFHNFPATYIPGTGLTPLKVVSEYFISLLLIGSILLLWRNRESFDRQVLNNLVIAIFLTIAAELTFTEYASFTDIFSLLGHVFRLVSYYFFYRAIIEVGQEKPYNLLYRNLTESEKKYRALSDLSPDAILVVQDGIIQYANNAGLRMSGAPSMEDLIGKELQDFVHPDDRSSSFTRIASVQSELVVAPLRELKVIAGGKTIHVEATAGPISWEGKPAAQVVIRDISERIRAEAALQEGEDRLRFALETCHTGAWDLDLTAHTAFRSEEHDRIFGYPAKLPEWTYEMFISHILPEDRTEVDAKFDHAIRTGGEWNFECRIRRTDNVVRWIHAAGRHRRDRGETQPRMAGIVQDITERKVAEEALRESEEKFRKLVKYAPAAIYEMDLGGTKFLSVNEVLCDILGYSRDELLHIKPIDLLDGESQAMFRERIRKKMAGEKIAEPVEYRIRRKDGVWIHTAISVGSVEYDQEKPDRVVVVGHDITERKVMELELKRRNEALNAAYEEIASTQEELQQNLEELSSRESQLQEALAEKEILLSEIHHRVKNNLTAFISLLSLEGAYEDTESGRALKKDLQNRARSMALIHETLYRTRKFSSVEMETYLTNLVSQIAGSYAEKGVVRTIVSAPEVVLDLGRATTAGLIINELITNSFKYAFPPGFDCMQVRGEPCTIRVTIILEDGAYVMTVADNGRGLPPGLDPLTTKSLGLKLVNFLARHQLRSDIEIRESEGTVFVFRLDNPEENL